MEAGIILQSKKEKNMLRICIHSYTYTLMYVNKYGSQSKHWPSTFLIPGPKRLRKEEYELEVSLHCTLSLRHPRLY